MKKTRKQNHSRTISFEKSSSNPDEEWIIFFNDDLKISHGEKLTKQELYEIYSYLKEKFNKEGI